MPGPMLHLSAINNSRFNTILSFTRGEQIMSIFKHCKTKSGFAMILCILCLLVLAILIPVAVAEEEHTWDRQKEYEKQLDEERRQREFQRELDEQSSKSQSQNYAAIAYSKSTHKWGYSWGKETQAQAEQESIRQCGVPDAEVLCWSQGSWYCALADGPTSYGAAHGKTAAIAKAEALRIANSYGPGANIVLLVGGNPPVVKKY
jgi:hypothetical protein